MKTVKIILVTIVIGLIAFFVLQWSVEGTRNVGDGKATAKATNQFVQKIENEIESLKASSANEFNKNVFKDIQAELNAFHDAEELGKDRIQNEEKYKSLSKILLSTYVPKFVEEAYSKFQASTWKDADLNFIRNEIKEIKAHEFFDSDHSEFSSEFNTINTIISRYYETVNLINQSKSFPTNLDYSVNGRFPLDQVKEKIAESKIYENYNSNNRYVNVTWLKEAIKEIPYQMYRRHYNFLETQIQQNSTKYVDLNSQADYSTKIYQPLKASLEQFDNDIYGVDYSSEFKVDYNELKSMLDSDNDNAGTYFKLMWNKQMKN